MSAKHWKDDDAGYEKWLMGHPLGYLANLNREPHKRYFLIHRASHKLPDRSNPGSINPRTGNNYSKLTADSISDLTAWLRERLPDFELSGKNYCKVCDCESDDPVVADPTPDPEEYVLRSEKLLARGPVARPVGIQKPACSNGVAKQYSRDPRVRAWVIQRAKGYCELCELEAPFVSDDDVAYLEAHHIMQLADGGPDTPENTAALCPNCHRKMHHGKERAKLRTDLGKVVAELEAALAGHSSVT